MSRLRRAKRAQTDQFPGFSDVTEIGAGSLATVYRARELETSRLVALKLVNVRGASPHAIDSFERESGALGAVSSHPNIVTLYRTFRVPDGRPVLVMELCRASVNEGMRHGEGLPVAEVVSMGIKIAGALETAHRAEILHRDVKPQNILISDFGEPALADFGVAMLQSATQTTAGLFDFTTLHAAPELLEGGETSAATDVYELASSIYQLIAGRSAFRAADGESPAAVILRILRDPVQPLVHAHVPAQLSDLLIYAMSKDKSERPPTAEEFAAELAAVEAGQGWPHTECLIGDARGAIAWLPGPKGVPPVDVSAAEDGPDDVDLFTELAAIADPEAAAEPVSEAAAEPVSEPVSEPGEAAWPESITLARPVPEAAARPEAVVRREPVARPEPEPVAEPVAEPVLAPRAVVRIDDDEVLPDFTPDPDADQLAETTVPSRARRDGEHWEPAPPPAVTAPPAYPGPAEKPLEPEPASAVEPPEPPSAPEPPTDPEPPAPPEPPSEPEPPAPQEPPVEPEPPSAPEPPEPPAPPEPPTDPEPPAPPEPPTDPEPPAPPEPPTDPEPAPTVPAAVTVPQLVSDISLDPMSLRRRVRIRSGASALVMDEVGLQLRVWWRRREIPWTDVLGFEPRFDGVNGKGGGGRLVVRTTTEGAIDLPATKRTMTDLLYIQALLDAYLARWRLLTNR